MAPTIGSLKLSTHLENGFFQRCWWPHSRERTTTRYVVWRVYIWKKCRSPFPTGHIRAHDVGEIVHSDVNVPTFNGENCYALFKDDYYSGFTKVYLMKSKPEAGGYFIQFVAFLETTTNKKVKVLRTDQGVEYLKIKSWCDQNKMEWVNGWTELRWNRRVVRYTWDNTHSDFQLKKSPRVLELWGEFLKSSIYVLNRTLLHSSVKTPFELFFKKKPNVTISELLVVAHMLMSLIACDGNSIQKPYHAGWLATEKKRRFGFSGNQYPGNY